MVNEVLETDIAREKLAEYVEERQVLLATKRGEALEEGRKKREKEQLKAKSVANGVMNGHGTDIIGKNQPVLANGNHIGQNGQIAKKKGEIFSARPNNPSKRRFHFFIVCQCTSSHTLTEEYGLENNSKLA